MSEAVKRHGSGAKQAGGQTGEPHSGLVDTAETLEQGVRDTAQEATDAVSDTMATVGSAVDETAGVVRAALEDGAASVRRAFDLPRQVRRQPWLMVAGAVLVGWMAGVALPRRRR